MTTLWICDRQWEFTETDRNVTSARPKGEKDWWMTEHAKNGWNRLEVLIDRIRSTV